MLIAASPLCPDTVYYVHLVLIYHPRMEVSASSEENTACSRLPHSSLVGLAVMIVLFPAPSWVAARTNGIQKEKMKAVSLVASLCWSHSDAASVD